MLLSELVVCPPGSDLPRHRIDEEIDGFGKGGTSLDMMVADVSAEMKQADFRSRMPPSLLGSWRGGRVREMESEEREVVLRFPTGGEAGPSRQLVKKCIDELPYR